MPLAKGRGLKKEKKRKKEREYNDNNKKLAPALPPPRSDVGVWSQVNYRHQGLRRRAAELGGGGERRRSSFEAACNYICTNVCTLFIIYFYVFNSLIAVKLLKIISQQ